MNRALSFNGFEVRDRGDQSCLTDMWRAAGSPLSREPFNWARKEGAPFIEAVSLTQNLTGGQVLTTTRGRNGSTMAHWQVGMGYAQYLSPDFHMWCNTVVRERMEGKPPTPVGSAAQIERTFGIVRMVAGKVTNIEGLVEALQLLHRTALQEHDHAILAAFSQIANDPFQDHASALEVCIEAKIPQRGRMGAVLQVTRRLKSYCDQRGIHFPRPNGRAKYPRQTIAEWRRCEGDRLLAARRDAASGQGRLPFRGEA